MVFLMIASMSFLMWIGGSIIYTFYAYILPAYHAFKAQELKSKKKRNKLLLHYVRYFIVFSFLMTASPFIGIVVPYWNILEIFIIYWMQSPKYRGCRYIYKLYLRPVFLRYERKIDVQIEKVEGIA